MCAVCNVARALPHYSTEAVHMTSLGQHTKQQGVTVVSSYQILLLPLDIIKWAHDLYRPLHKHSVISAFLNTACEHRSSASFID